MDAILSFKNAPKYVIYDDAGRLAEHAFKRLDPEKYCTLIGANKGEDFVLHNFNLINEYLTNIQRI